MELSSSAAVLTNMLRARGPSTAPRQTAAQYGPRVCTTHTADGASADHMHLLRCIRLLKVVEYSRVFASKENIEREVPVGYG